MPEFSKYGEYYRDALLAANTANFEAEQDPAMAESFRASARQAIRSMDFMEPEALEDYKKAVSFVPPVDPEVEIERSDLIALQSTPAYLEGLIKEKVDQRLASLPVPETYSREDLDFAAYILRCVGATQDQDEPQSLESITVVTETVEGATDDSVEPVLESTGDDEVEAVSHESPEAEAVTEDPVPLPTISSPLAESKDRDHRRHVRVRLYLGDHVIVVGDDNGLAIPITREAKQSSLTPEQDSLVEEMRMQALAYFINHPDEQPTTKVWEGLVGDRMKFNSTLWYTHVAPFIQELKVDGRRLILDRKPTPDAKRRYYRLNPDFVPEIDVLEEESGRDFFTIFKVVTAEGRSTIAGATGKLGNLLIRSSADNPLSLEKLLASGVFSQKEIDAMDDDYKDSLLSGMVSSMRASLRELYADHVYKIHRVKDPVLKRPSGRPVLNYWMERREIDSALQERIEHGYAIAKYIEGHKERVEGAGMPAIDPEVSEALADWVPQRRAERLAQDFKSARKFLIQEFEKFNDPQLSDELFDSIPSHDHPLTKLLDYMFEVAAEEKEDTLLRALHPRHGAEFESRTSGIGSRAEALRQMDRALSPVIKEALAEMHRSGIFREEGITKRQVMNVWHGLHSGKIERYLRIGNHNEQLLSVSQVVQAFLKDNKELAGFFSRPSDRRRIAEIIEREIEVFKNSLKEQSE